MHLNPVALFDLLLGVAVVAGSFLPRSSRADRPEHWKGKLFLFFRLMGAVLILLALLRLLGIYGAP